MKEKLESIFKICFWPLLAIAVMLYLLSHVPITKTTRYDMRGFIVTPDGEILEEFDFTVTGKDYNFIIDPPGGLISFTGDKLTQLERDAFILTFDRGSSSIAKSVRQGISRTTFTLQTHRCLER